MSFQPPVLDDRTFQQIVDEVRKRIPLYCPEWTDHNLSDPGITLIELFAWMTELLIYRLNQVPELHYIKFAELLGVQRASPRAAFTRMTFWLTRPLTHLVDPDDSGLLIAKHTQVSTTQTEVTEPIIFTTDKEFVIHAPRFQQLVVQRQGTKPVLPGNQWRPLSALEVQSLRDGTDSLPLFSDEPQVDDAVYFGFANNLSHHVIRFELNFDEKAGIGINVKHPPYHWEIYSTQGNYWEPVEADPDSTRGMNAASGSVTLHLPELRSHELEADAVTKRQLPALYWIRVRIKAILDSEVRAGMRKYNKTPELLQIVQIAAIGCAIAATNANYVEQEQLGVSDGSAGQRFHLSSRSILLPLQPDERLRVQLHEKQVEYWTCQPDFAASHATSRHFVIDSESGEVRFGPAVRQPNGEIHCYGAIPPRTATLWLERYRYGGGAKGNLPKKVINILRSSIPYVAGVENRVAATGGLDAPGVDELEVAVQRRLRTRRVAITPEDFEAHVLEQFGNEIARVRCLPLQKEATVQQKDGVRILVIPKVSNSANQRSGYLSDDQIHVSVALQQQIERYLDNFRLLTYQIVVKNPRYRRIGIKGQITALPGTDEAQLHERIVQQLNHFLNPLTGGRDERGWPFAFSLTALDVEERIKMLPDVQGVTLDNFVLQIGEQNESHPTPFQLEAEDMVVAGEHQFNIVATSGKDRS